MEYYRYMDYAVYLKLFMHNTITLLTIVNPLAAVSIMISLVDMQDKKIVKDVSKKATLVVLIASVVTLFAGEYIFRLFGINVLSIKVIGGIIIMLISIHMVYGQPLTSKHTQEESDEAKDKEDIAIVPLGIPILFGPGTIALLTVLNTPGYGIYGYVATLFAIIATSAVLYAVLLYASSIYRVFGVTGIKILTRIMGLILGAIAAQLLVSGIKGLWGV